MTRNAEIWDVRLILGPDCANLFPRWFDLAHKET
jgi:hypothetical protein